MLTRVLLIQPPVDRLQHRLSPREWTRSLGAHPPLGLMYLAAHLESHGHEVRILDLRVNPLSRDDFGTFLRSFGPAITGMGVLTFNLLAALELTSWVKEFLPGTIQVLGGPHATEFPLETSRQPFVDFVVAGDGEYILERLASDPASAGNIPDLISGGNPKPGGQTAPSRISDRDNLPFPARHLVHPRAYHSITTRHLPMTSMITGSGCPYACIYCSTPKIGNPYFRSVEGVLAEMVECARLGYREIAFHDDIFTLDRDRILDLCGSIRKAGLHLAWDCRTRVDRVDAELLAEMRHAGCYRIQYGIESGSQRILDVLHKGIAVEQAERAVHLTREAGIQPSGSFMIGSPGETEEDIQKTIQFACSLPLAHAQFSITTPFPNTKLYENGFALGMYRKDYWKEFASRPKPDFLPRYWENWFSSKELQKRQKLAFRAFYYRPGYIIRQLTELRSLEEIKYKFSLGIRLAREIFF